MKKITKIMFVCHGNICRSPMAEFIMRRLAEERDMGGELQIASSATSSEEIGNAVYPPAKRELARHGIGCEGKVARRFTVADYNAYDFVVVMEDYNIRNLMRIIACDCASKVWKLLDFIDVDTPEAASLHRGRGADISDPWYHRDFEQTYNEIHRGCEALLNYITDVSRAK